MAPSFSPILKKRVPSNPDNEEGEIVPVYISDFTLEFMIYAKMKKSIPRTKRKRIKYILYLRISGRIRGFFMIMSFCKRIVFRQFFA